MPKNPSSNLFDLIKSLTKQEKISFTLYTKRNEKKLVYIKLFETINNRGEYNEEYIRKLMGLTSSHLSELKNYLYNLILESLEIHHKESNAEIILHRTVIHIHILYKKGLYSQCLKLVKKAYKIAEVEENFSVMTELYYWESLLAQKNRNILELKNALKNKDRIRECFTKNYNLFEYTELKLQAALLIVQRQIFLNRAETTKVNTILSHKLLSDGSGIMSDKARVQYYQIKNVLFASLCDFVSSNQILDQFIQFMEDKQGITSSNLSTYCNTLHNKIVFTLSINKFEEAQKNLKKLDHAIMLKKQLDKTDLHVTLLSYYTLSSGLYIKTGEFQKGLEYISLLKKDFIFNNLPKSKQLILHHNCAYLFIGTNAFRNALSELNAIVNTATDERSDIFSFAKILLLIVHYELNNMELLESLIRSTLRYFLKKGNLFKFEKAIINFIGKKLPRVNGKKELIAAFKDLKEELMSLSHDSVEKSAFEYFDFISWLESKIENRPFVKIVIEKAKIVNG
ncbi:MAG: hypothetical protein HYU69_02685 [Bacteroidetes bacterium]|nr:hypothetical protein [Bacteroidota bacterium]